MRRSFSKLGLIGSVLLVTIASLILALGCTTALVFFFNNNGADADIKTALIIAFMVTVIVTPITSWFIIRLLLNTYRLEEEMRKLATYDSLTGLFNRRVFMERVQLLYNIARRENQPFSVLIADIDHFKKVNDNYGHTAGDKALASFGELVSRTLRKSDLVCRFGGEEFAFFLPNTTPEKAWDFTKRFHDIIRNSTIEYNGSTLQFTVSIGIASFSGNITDSFEEVLNLADKALYHAKSKGRNQTAMMQRSKTDPRQLSFNQLVADQDIHSGDQ